MITLRAAVRTEALVYGDMSRHIKERQNAIYCLLCSVHMRQNLRYEYMYRYTPNLYIYIYFVKLVKNNASGYINWNYIIFK